MPKLQVSGGAPIGEATGRPAALPSPAPRALVTAAAAPFRKPLRYMLASVLAAQDHQASREIYDHLRSLSDRTLTEIGFDAKQITILRAGGEVDFPG